MKIKVEPLFPTGTFLNCRIGVEIDIPDDGDMELEINTMWDNLTAIHMKRYPQFYKDGKPTYLPQVADYKGGEIITELHVDKPVKSMIEEMEACATPEEILSFRFTIKNNEEQAVYDRKVSELSFKNQ